MVKLIRHVEIDKNYIYKLHSIDTGPTNERINSLSIFGNQ